MMIIKTTAFGIAGLALALAAYVTPASASPVETCGSGQLVSELSRGDSCFLGDKIFTFYGTGLDGSSLPGGTTVDILNPGGGLTYILRLNFGDGLTEGLYDFAYGVEVTDPDYYISRITVDSDAQPQTGDTDVTKYVRGSDEELIGTINSHNGEIDSLGLNETSVFIYETFSVTADQFILSASNAVTQEHVPAPAALGLLGLGLIGLGFATRRRKAA